MNNHGLTDKELSALSPEEREAVEAEYSEDELKLHGGKDAGAASTAAEAQDEEDKKIEAENKAAAEKVAAEKVAADAAVAAAGGAASAPAAAAAERTDSTPFAVPFHHQPTVKPEDAQAKLDALQTEYEAGDMKLNDYLVQRDEIKAALMKDQIATDIAQNSQEQMASALWSRTVDTFLDDNPAYRKDDVLYGALDDRVKKLAADPKNVNLTDRQLLTKAHDDIKSRFKVADDGKTPDAKKALEQQRQPDLKNLPRTLGGLPVASENITADDEFAELERLNTSNPAEYERQLAKLTPAQADRFLRGATA